MGKYVFNFIKYPLGFVFLIKIKPLQQLEIKSTIKDVSKVLEENGLSKRFSSELADWMFQNTKRINIFWEIIKQEQEPVCRRAAYALDTCAERNANQVQHLVPDLINFLMHTKSNPLRRHISRMLAKSPLPAGEEEQGLLAECCFNFLSRTDVDVAVKAHCIDLIFRLCKIYPELEVEFHSVLRDQMEKNSTAFLTRARKILKGDYKVN